MHNGLMSGHQYHFHSSKVTIVTYIAAKIKLLCWQELGQNSFNKRPLFLATGSDIDFTCFCDMFCCGYIRTFGFMWHILHFGKFQNYSWRLGAAPVPKEMNRTVCLEAHFYSMAHLWLQYFSIIATSNIDLVVNILHNIYSMWSI